MDITTGRPAWKKSTKCSSGGCVEVAPAPSAQLVRDSKLLDESPILVFAEARWREFVAGVKDGQFDL
ncbi:hypothetical protein Val02_44660 [Virgisporangium aliadipatigenens]|uniref:DUF397 domain-containing protein n=1 Tax=Virgisporangium aliadipatigenens TaxID=741659 RepID=A0A8J3YPD2_9ACTN|nr:DUF397 domain-containing protein [Virgisporangium aliadipatigenens]GIJ47580.1 hypothetical protein Val02_44660 [Virgisporangium aliadipatigenens]